MKAPQNHKKKNLMPACPACDAFKRDLILDDFRYDVFNSLEKLNKLTAYQNAKRFGIIKINEPEHVFYFEKRKRKKKQIINAVIKQNTKIDILIILFYLYAFTPVYLITYLIYMFINKVMI